MSEDLLNQAQRDSLLEQLEALMRTLDKPEQQAQRESLATAAAVISGDRHYVLAACPFKEDGSPAHPWPYNPAAKEPQHILLARLIGRMKSTHYENPLTEESK